MIERHGTDLMENDEGDIDFCPECGHLCTWNRVPAEPERHDEPGHAEYEECDQCGAAR